MGTLREEREGEFALNSLVIGPPEIGVPEYVTDQGPPLQLLLDLIPERCFVLDVES